MALLFAQVDARAMHTVLHAAPLTHFVRALFVCPFHFAIHTVNLLVLLLNCVCVFVPLFIARVFKERTISPVLHLIKCVLLALSNGALRTIDATQQKS